MKYYIIKKKSAAIRQDILDGIRRTDNNAKVVDELENCDIAVLQQGWTMSRTAVAERNRALSELHKPCREGYLYTDKYKAHVN